MYITHDNNLVWYDTTEMYARNGWHTCTSLERDAETTKAHNPNKKVTTCLDDRMQNCIHKSERTDCMKGCNSVSWL